MTEILEKILFMTLYVITFAYDVITLPIYFFIQHPWEKLKLASKRMTKCISSDETQITWKSLQPVDKYHILVSKEKADTIEKVCSLTSKLYNTQKCLGTRQILKEIDEVQADGSVMKKYIMGDYKWQNFHEMNLEADYFGKGCRELGVMPRDKVAIFAETRAEWMIAAQGLFKHSCGVVTIYATLGEDGIIHAINQTEVSIVITSHDLIPKLKKILKDVPMINSIIYFESQIHKTDIEGMDKAIVLPYKRVIEMGRNSSFENVSPSEHDLAILMYTSGSSGVAKGVLLTHKNLLATMKGLTDGLKTYSNDILIGVLPLAHCFELLVECSCMLAGVRIGYSSPLTLTDASPKLAKGQKSDAKILMPTMMACVPLLLDRIAKGIREKLDNGPVITKLLFKFAFEYKKMWYRRGYDTPINNRIIFKKVRAIMGGSMRSMTCGGAPLSSETHDIIRHCLCTVVRQGFGCTETTSMGSVMNSKDITTGSIGYPSSIGYIKLVNWKEGNYFVTNKPNPQGEILVGGENVAVGYYKLPEETDAAFVEEDGIRWFRTGDIGEFLENGNVKLIDRRKDLVKLQHGEYLSLGKIESELKTCQIIENICVYADSSKMYCIALVQPSVKGLNKLAASSGLQLKYEELCEHQDVITAALNTISEHGKSHGLNKFEIPAKIALCAEAWTPDSGLTTAAFKIKRREVQKRYWNVIQNLYN